MSACVARAGQHKFCGTRVLTVSFSAVDGKQDRRPAHLAADSEIPPIVSLRRMKSIHWKRLSFQSNALDRCFNRGCFPLLTSMLIESQGGAQRANAGAVVHFRFT